MPFIGNQPALSYTSFAKQDFSTSATTSYTLDNPVANANELALFINFVSSIVDCNPHSHFFFSKVQFCSLSGASIPWSLILLELI